MGVDVESIAKRKKQYECPHFRILVIGRANAGKTTILEKVCGVAQGTKPIIFDEYDNELKANIGPRLELESLPSPAGQLFDRKPSPSSINSKSSTHLKSSPAGSVTHLTPSMEVSKVVQWYIWISIHWYAINVRGVYMILSTRSPTLEATLFSMTLRVLKEVQAKRWRLFGHSLKSGLLQLKWRIGCMQFGILYGFFTLLDSWPNFHRYCIPMDSTRPLLSKELEFFSKGIGKGKSNHLVLLLYLFAIWITNLLHFLILHHIKYWDHIVLIMKSQFPWWLYSQNLMLKSFKNMSC